MISEEILKQITVLMRNLAFEELDKNEAFRKLPAAEQDCMIFSLFHHGAKCQAGILAEIHGVEIELVEA